jgi:hypothetical protein
VSIRIIDHGLRRRLLSFLGPATVSVGVHEQEGAARSSDGQVTVAQVAAFHEFGLGVPERSWLRDFVDEHRSELLAMLREVGVQIARGADTDQAMAGFGLAVVGMMKERIIAGIEPELAEETRRKKQQITGGGAKDTPLILFGQFISSIAHQVHK